MIDFRCVQCNRLLAKIEGMAKVEIKCSRCKTMNLFTEEIFITIEEKEDTCTDPEIAES
ncbi:MAG: Com family DNA-binding transcriptional regulator [Candidatus Margulisbacteria bacterium]|nr:Com family DNA-binding transcriptional regulator [Candidatus Margulisiibacteriota bacterium]